MADSTFVQEPYVSATFEIFHSADWSECIGPFHRQSNGALVSFVGMQLDLYVRAGFGGALVARFSSAPADAAGGLMIDDDAAGLASIRITRSRLVAVIPAWTWSYHLVVSPPAEPFSYLELMRGPLIVNAGRT